MIKLVYAVTARSDISPAEFRRYWREEHAPKVRSVAQAIGAIRYVQSHALNTLVNQRMTESRAMPGGYDGITEIWFQSLEEFQHATSTADGSQAIKMLTDDERTFIDMSRSTIFMTEEYEIFDLAD